MPDSDIQRLVERIEASGPEMQYALIEEAWEVCAASSAAFRRFATAHCSGFGTSAGKFSAALEAHAFESAAMTLIPDDWTAWEIRSHSARTRFSADLSRMTECDSAAEDWARGRGSTPALAIAVASLRARITERTDTPLSSITGDE